MSVKVGIATGKQLTTALYVASETAKRISPGRLAVLHDNNKLIAVTVDAGSQEEGKLKWLHGSVLKDPDGKIEFNEDGSPKMVRNLLLAELSKDNGEKTSVTRYYEPHMDMLHSLGMVFDLSCEKSHDLAQAVMKKGKAGDISDIGGATGKDGKARGGHW